ncbi:hypothetical protein [Azospirillum sp.]|uniref:hypothetical protein n=1 Tax=Azospirillum sp. TaxID=34012 RepID=UPI003D75EC6C
MSVSVLEKVWNSPREIEGLTKYVLARLACFASDDGTGIYPTIGRVATDCGIGVRTVRNSFRDLEAVGVLVKVADEDPGRHRAREYRIDLKALSTPGTTCRPAQHAARHTMPGTPAPRAATPRHHVPPNSNKQSSGNSEGKHGLFGDSVVIPLETKKRAAKPKAEAADIEAEFQVWYAQAPRKEAPAAARTAYLKARKKASAADLLAGIMRYAARVETEGTPRQYIKKPNNWLRDECWLDDAGPTHAAPRHYPTGKPNVMDAAAKVFSDDPAAAHFREMFK